ncbi:SDR family NAD(P)-dependent oxidoreductase [Nocardia transvalensis]|uniref:SDR family NAD(P)-dependent oxidoreductase n=1 Tax=Nocardia transvalensis TaxID=37333 RepID=UPI001894CCA9|nr:SDR family NAD(P)-dependent oxidoreductase [Nocardia transvalensis]MBF6328876.1 SDR family NAD(P)-dependent oxidoreductase [Nocardia transvalensis]
MTEAGPAPQPVSIVGIGYRAAGADLDGFDNDWFALSERDAALLDPRQRLGLTVAVEAIDDAGIGYRVRGAQGAVIFRACGCGAGPASTGVAKRLSTALDLRGPSLMLDSGSSSPMVAVDLAVRLLADDAVAFAIVGGIHPPLSVRLPEPPEPGELSASDACRDGCHGGCTALVLQRTADARREGNRIHAEIGPSGSGGAAVVLRGVATPARSRGVEPPLLIPLTGRDSDEVRERAGSWANLLVDKHPSLGDFAAAAGRLLPEAAHGAVVVHNHADAVSRLRALARAQETSIPGEGAGRRDRVLGPSVAQPRGGVLFLFSGPGGQHARMGRALAARFPVFADAVAEAAEAIVGAGGPRVWTPRHGFGQGLAVAEAVQPAIFAFQLALSKLLLSWGIRADGVGGYGLGEVAAAVVGGAVSTADGARIAVARGRAVARCGERAASATLAATAEEAARLIEPMRGEVEIAAILGPRALVLSGTPRYVEAVVRRARRREMAARLVAAEWAADGHRIRRMPLDSVAQLQGLAPKIAEVPFFSSSRRGGLLTTAPDSEYWAENFCGTVDLASCLASAAAEGMSTVIEVGPNPVLTPAVRRYREFRASTYTVAEQENEAEAFLHGLAELYVGGRWIDWSAQGSFAGPIGERRWRTGSSPAVHGLADIRAHRRIDGDPTPAEIVGWMRTVDAHRATHHQLQAIDPEAFYEALRRRHLDYGPRPLRRLAVGKRSAIGLFGHIPLDTAALDGCLQVVAAATMDLLPDTVPSLPVSIASVWLSDAPDLLLTEAHAFVRDKAPTGPVCDVIATDQHGAPAITLLGVEFSPADGAAHAPTVSRNTRDSNGSSTSGANTGPVSLLAEENDSRVDHEFEPCATTGYEWLVAPAYDATVATAVEWAASILRTESWVPVAVPDAAPSSVARRAVLIGASPFAVALAAALGKRLPTARVARDCASLTAALSRRREPAAVVVVWPGAVAAGSVVAEVAAALVLLHHLCDSAAVSAVTVVLDDRASVLQHAVAGLVRALRQESVRPIRLVWLAGATPRDAAELAVHSAAPEEVLLDGSAVHARRFLPAHPTGRSIEIVPDGTYVVTGGLGTLGAVAVRWLLRAGARDVVVLTRRPRPLPPLLDGSEDRIVVVRCDVADRVDLSNALDDIRGCGSTIRGLVHAAGVPADTEIRCTTAAATFTPKVTAAEALLELTAADPIDFALLFSCATGTLGLPGGAAGAAADAALDAVARARTHTDRRIVSIGWGSWESGPVAASSNASLSRRAGIVPFDTARGTAVLSAALGYREPALLALDYTPIADESVLSNRLRSLLPVSGEMPLTRTSTAHLCEESP